MSWLSRAKYHLETETGWGYWYHLWHSIKNSATLINIAFKSVVHGVFPWVWKSDSPRAVIKLYHQIMRIDHIQKMDPLRDLPKNERYRDTTTDSAKQLR